MPKRDALLADAASPRRIAAAHAADADFAAFLDEHDLSRSIEAVALYLTRLHESTPMTGRALRERLHLLDLHRRLAGEPPWSDDPDLHGYLHGLHRLAPREASMPRCDPLYPELLRAVVDATMLPSRQQRRGVVAVLLRNETGLPAAAIARLTWDDVHLTGTQAQISVTRTVGRGNPTPLTYRVPARLGQPGCLVAALRQLRTAGPSGRYVVANNGGPADQQRVRDWLTALPAHPRSPTPRLPALSGRRIAPILAAIAAPSPAQVRDRALLLMGYGAALRTGEATRLHQGDVEVHERGLLLTVSGRSRPTAIPTSSLPDYDPIGAWTTWLSHMRGQHRAGPAGPAFRQVSFSQIWRPALTPAGLNFIVRQRCTQAGLAGTFNFSSLRVGLIRTALRENDALHVVAAQADLTSLGSVLRHEQREQLLRHNVAGMLGL